MQLFQTGEDRYRPQDDAAHATINQRSLALIVGVVALGLPLVLILGSVNPINDTCFRDSISHYYYAQFWGSVFIGALIFIGTYLLVYQGEDEEGAEGRLATFAGFMAYGVALFPTGGHGCGLSEFSARALLNFKETGGKLDLVPKLDANQNPLIDAYFQLTSYSGALHYLCAATLFLFLTWFALFVFTAVDDDQRVDATTLKPAKIARNRIYYFCGGVMVACVATLAIYGLLRKFLPEGSLAGWDTYNLTFWCEALALWAFGISWMVKGRFLDLIFR